MVSSHNHVGRAKLIQVLDPFSSKPHSLIHSVSIYGASTIYQALFQAQETHWRMSQVRAFCSVTCSNANSLWLTQTTMHEDLAIVNNKYIKTSNHAVLFNVVLLKYWWEKKKQNSNSWPGPPLCGVSTFSPSLCRFSLGRLASPNIPKLCTWSELLHLHCPSLNECERGSRCALRWNDVLSRVSSYSALVEALVTQDPKLL